MENRQNTDKRLKNLKTDAGPGRPKGRRNFSTIFYDALENLAKKNNMDALSLETEIVEKALLSARKGDARFYKDLMDRVHGQATQSIKGDADNPLVFKITGVDINVRKDS